MLQIVVDRCRRGLLVLVKYGPAFLLVISVGLNVSLSRELRATRRQPEGGVLVGTILPPISGVTTHGMALTIQPLADRPTIFYYFSATCGWCDRNWPNIEALVRQTSGRYRVVGVAATAEIPAAVHDRAIPLPILTSVDADILAAYGFRGTPQTVVIGQDGRVLKSWTGAYQGDQAESVANFFGVTMPGLLPKRSLQ